jgi:hypothetical protein
MVAGGQSCMRMIPPGCRVCAAAAISSADAPAQSRESPVHSTSPPAIYAVAGKGPRLL